MSGLDILPEGVSDPYKVLGISNDASEHDIRRAYRRRARKLHPDKCDSSDAQTQFLTLQKTYEFLTDKLKRAKFDSHFAREQDRLDRLQKITGARRKFAVTLEAREAASKRTVKNTTEYSIELDRLRSENDLWIQNQRSKISSIQSQPSNPSKYNFTKSQHVNDHTSNPSRTRSNSTKNNNTSVSQADASATVNNHHSNSSSKDFPQKSSADASATAAGKKTLSLEQRESIILARLKEVAARRRHESQSAN